MAFAMAGAYHRVEAPLFPLAIVSRPQPAIHDYATGTPQISRSPYREMAERIARNCEVLGLHYPNDSHAGKKIAEKLFQNLETSTAFSELMEKAKAERNPSFSD